MITMSPSFSDSGGNSANMLITAGGMLPRCTGMATPWEMVSPLTSNRATEQSPPSLTIDE